MLVIEIVNDGTGTPEVASYHVRVRVNAITLARGRVEGFERVRGWRTLAWAAISQAEAVDQSEATLTTLARSVHTLLRKEPQP